MAGRRKTDFEDNFYRRAQLAELARTEFPPLHVLKGEDDSEWMCANPTTLDDDVMERIEDASSQLTVARIYLETHHGEGTWDEFKAAGGQSWHVMLAIKTEQDRLQGITPGEGRPTT